MKPFDLEAAKAGAKLVTRDGREAVFIAHVPELRIDSRVLVRIDNRVFLYYENGNFLNGICPNELLMAPTKRTVYVNFHDDGRSHWYYSQEDAKKMVGHTAFAVAVPVEIEE